MNKRTLARSGVILLGVAAAALLVLATVIDHSPTGQSNRRGLAETTNLGADHGDDVGTAARHSRNRNTRKNLIKLTDCCLYGKVRGKVCMRVHAPPRRLIRSALPFAGLNGALEPRA